MFVITVSSPFSISSKSNISVIASYSSFKPFFVLVDIFIVFLFKLAIFLFSSFILSSLSILFNKIMAFLFFINSNIFSSSSSKLFELSKIAIIKSDSSIKFIAFSTPIFSILSLVFLIPAVSTIFIGIPFIEIYSSIVSLVVPSISLTIALSSFNSKFKSDDLPVLGFPIITVFTPSLNILPLSKLFSKCSNSSFTDFNFLSTLFCVTFSISYSG